MKKLNSIILLAFLSFIIVSCGPKEILNTADAPEDIKNAVENSYQLSRELTDLQLEAGSDMKLDEAEIREIGETFRYLAIVNNQNAKDYASNKYFIALRKEYKDAFDVLADTVVFLKDCEGFDQLGIAIQNISIEVRDVTTLPETEPEIIEIPDTMSMEDPEGTSPE